MNPLYCIAFIFISSMVLADQVVPLDRGTLSFVGSSSSQPTAPSSVNINRASAEQLAATLKGVGLKKRKLLLPGEISLATFSTLSN